MLWFRSRDTDPGNPAEMNQPVSAWYFSHGYFSEFREKSNHWLLCATQPIGLEFSVTEAFPQTVSNLLMTGCPVWIRGMASPGRFMMTWCPVWIWGMASLGSWWPGTQSGSGYGITWLLIPGTQSRSGHGITWLLMTWRPVWIWAWHHLAADDLAPSLDLGMASPGCWYLAPSLDLGMASPGCWWPGALSGSGHGITWLLMTWHPVWIWAWHHLAADDLAPSLDLGMASPGCWYLAPSLDLGMASPGCWWPGTQSGSGHGITWLLMTWHPVWIWARHHLAADDLAPCLDLGYDIWLTWHPASPNLGHGIVCCWWPGPCLDLRHDISADDLAPC